MSLFNLIHQSVVIKFSDLAKPLFDSNTSYVFRLTAVDGMGFLEIQEIKLGADGTHETTGSAPFWVNKDLVLELRAYDTAKTQPNVVFSGKSTPPAKATKPKPAPKPKPAA
jgi:hypothetical protein